MSSIAESIRRFREAAPKPREERRYSGDAPRQWWRESSESSSEPHPLPLPPSLAPRLARPPPRDSFAFGAAPPSSGAGPSSSLEAAHRYKDDSTNLSMSIDRLKGFLDSDALQRPGASSNVPSAAAPTHRGPTQPLNDSSFQVHTDVDMSVPLAVSASSLRPAGATVNYSTMSGYGGGNGQASSVDVSQISDPLGIRGGRPNASVLSDSLWARPSLLGPPSADTSADHSRLSALTGASAASTAPVDAKHLQQAGFSDSAIDALRRLAEKNPTLYQALLKMERGADGRISERTVERVRAALGESRRTPTPSQSVLQPSGPPSLNASLDAGPPLPTAAAAAGPHRPGSQSSSLQSEPSIRSTVAPASTDISRMDAPRPGPPPQASHALQASVIIASRDGALSEQYTMSFEASDVLSVSAMTAAPSPIESTPKAAAAAAAAPVLASPAEGVPRLSAAAPALAPAPVPTTVPMPAPAHVPVPIPVPAVAPEPTTVAAPRPLQPLRPSAAVIESIEILSGDEMPLPSPLKGPTPSAPPTIASTAATDPTLSATSLLPATTKTTTTGRSPRVSVSITVLDPSSGEVTASILKEEEPDAVKTAAPAAAAAAPERPAWWDKPSDSEEEDEDLATLFRTSAAVRSSRAESVRASAEPKAQWRASQQDRLRQIREKQREATAAPVSASYADKSFHNSLRSSSTSDSSIIRPPFNTSARASTAAAPPPVKPAPAPASLTRPDPNSTLESDSDAEWTHMMKRASAADAKRATSARTDAPRAAALPASPPATTTTAAAPSTPAPAAPASPPPPLPFVPQPHASQAQSSQAQQENAGGGKPGEVRVTLADGVEVTVRLGHSNQPPPAVPAAASMLPPSAPLRPSLEPSEPQITGTLSAPAPAADPYEEDEGAAERLSSPELPAAPLIPTAHIPGRRSRSALKDIRERFEKDRKAEEERSRLQQISYSELLEFLHPMEAARRAGGVPETFRESKKELDLSGILALRNAELQTRVAAAAAAAAGVDTAPGLPSTSTSAPTAAAAKGRVSSGPAAAPAAPPPAHAPAGPLPSVSQGPAPPMPPSAMAPGDAATALVEKVGGTATHAVNELHALAEILDRANREKRALLEKGRRQQEEEEAAKAAAAMDAAAAPPSDSDEPVVRGARKKTTTAAAAASRGRFVDSSSDFGDFPVKKTRASAKRVPVVTAPAAAVSKKKTKDKDGKGKGAVSVADVRSSFDQKEKDERETRRRAVAANAAARKTGLAAAAAQKARLSLSPGKDRAAASGRESESPGRQRPGDTSFNASMDAHRSPAKRALESPVKTVASPSPPRRPLALPSQDLIAPRASQTESDRWGRRSLGFGYRPLSPSVDRSISSVVQGIMKDLDQALRPVLALHDEPPAPAPAPLSLPAPAFAPQSQATPSRRPLDMSGLAPADFRALLEAERPSAVTTDGPTAPQGRYPNVHWSVSNLVHYLTREPREGGDATDPRGGAGAGAGAPPPLPRTLPAPAPAPLSLPGPVSYALLPTAAAPPPLASMAAPYQPSYSQQQQQQQQMMAPPPAPAPPPHPPRFTLPSPPPEPQPTTLYMYRPPPQAPAQPPAASSAPAWQPQQNEPGWRPPAPAAPAYAPIYSGGAWAPAPSPPFASLYQYVPTQPPLFLGAGLSAPSQTQPYGTYAGYSARPNPAQSEKLNPHVAGRMEVERALADTTNQVAAVFGDRGPPEAAARVLQEFAGPGSAHDRQQIGAHSSWRHGQAHIGQSGPSGGGRASALYAFHG